MAALHPLGWCACALMLAAFSCKDVRHLRALAILANVAFLAYGATAALWPIVALHAILLPVNAWRLARELHGRRTLRATAEPAAPAATGKSDFLHTPSRVNAYPEIVIAAYCERRKLPPAPGCIRQEMLRRPMDG